MRVDGMMYFPGVITIDAGDTVEWTLSGAEPHTVSFLGGARPPVPGSPAFEQPIGGHVYNGQGEVSSGLLLPVPGHQSYSLTFTQPGIYPYRCFLHPNQQGVVIVNAAGTPYPETQSQYTREGQAEWHNDLALANTAQKNIRPLTTIGSSGRTTVQAFIDATEPSKVAIPLNSVNNSTVHGVMILFPLGPSSAKALVSLTGLAPESTYSVEIRPGDRQSVGNPLYSLPVMTANTQGNATLTTTLSPMDGIASAGWVVDVRKGHPSPPNPTTSFLAFGSVSLPVYALMRYEPSTLIVHTGDEVVWTQLNVDEIHTVTFLAAGQKPPEFPSPEAINPAEGSTYDGQGYFNSGILGPFQSYHLVFDRPGV